MYYDNRPLETLASYAIAFCIRNACGSGTRRLFPLG
jgi:hypothetical protein